MKQILLTICLLVSAGASAQAEVVRSSGSVEPKQQMEKLASKGLEETVLLVKEQGGFYPYAILMRPDDTLQVMAYSGSTELRPAVSQFANELTSQVRALLTTNDSYSAAILLKPHTAQNESGETIKGIWAVVDHRDYEAWVVFVPFVLSGEKTYTLGELVYLPAKTKLFP